MKWVVIVDSCGSVEFSYSSKYANIYIYVYFQMSNIAVRLDLQFINGAYKVEKDSTFGVQIAEDVMGTNCVPDQIAAAKNEIE